MFINVTKFDRFGNITKTVHVNLDDDIECLVDDDDEVCEDEFDDDELYWPCENNICGQVCFANMQESQFHEEFDTWRKQLLELSNGRLDIVNKDGSLKNPIDILTDFMVLFKDEWMKIAGDEAQREEKSGVKKNETTAEDPEEEKREAIRKSVLQDLDDFWASGDDSVTIRIEREQ